jgi:hypothetical protein
MLLGKLRSSIVSAKFASCCVAKTTLVKPEFAVTAQTPRIAPFEQGVREDGLQACVYAGAGSGAGSAPDMIFLGIEIPGFSRISAGLSGIFVR